MLLDLHSRPLVAALGMPPEGGYDWEEFAALWDANELRCAHDWLNSRWSRLVETRLAGQADPEARFLQGLAYAALALHFAQCCNQDGALLMIDDATLALMHFRPQFLGVRVDPVIETLQGLRPTIAGLAPDAEYPFFPFVYRRFEHRSRSHEAG
ncbi:MAG: hypothetical protein WBO23_00075 [Burkholderiales bacterium]